MNSPSTPIANVTDIRIARKRALTMRQQKVLDFIRDAIAEKQKPPTLREIGEHLGIRSTNGIVDHLKALERKGYLTRESMKSRGLIVLENGVPVRPPTETSFESAKSETARLRELLLRARNAFYSQASLTPETVKVLEDIKDELAGRTR